MFSLEFYSEYMKKSKGKSKDLKRKDDLSSVLEKIKKIEKANQDLLTKNQDLQDEIKLQKKAIWRDRLIRYLIQILSNDTLKNYVGDEIESIIEYLETLINSLQ